MPPRRESAPGIPHILKGESPTAKALWLWLEPRGVVDYSQRAMAAALGFDVSTLGGALKRLRELGLVEDLERSPRARGRLRARAEPTGTATPTYKPAGLQTRGAFSAATKPSSNRRTGTGSSEPTARVRPSRSSDQSW